MLIPTCTRVRTTVRKDADTAQELRGHLRHHISAAGVTKAKKRKKEPEKPALSHIDRLSFVLKAD